MSKEQDDLNKTIAFIVTAAAGVISGGIYHAWANGKKMQESMDELTEGMKTLRENQKKKRFWQK